MASVLRSKCRQVAQDVSTLLWKHGEMLYLVYMAPFTMRLALRKLLSADISHHDPRERFISIIVALSS